MTTTAHNFIKSKLGMKRSFNCPQNLCSIGDSVGVVDADREYEYSQQPSKRRRAYSTSSACSAVCDCCWEEGRTSCTDSLLLLPPLTSIKPSLTISTQVQAVTPELAPVEMPSSEEIRVAPSFPLLKGLKESSSCIDDCPATAALERFMLPQKSVDRLANSRGDDEGDYSHFSFDDQACDDSHSSSWSKDANNSDASFPQKLDSASIPSSQEDDYDRRPRSVSFLSTMSSLLSVSDSSWSSRTNDSVSADASLLSMLSSCTLEPTKKQMSKRSVPTVNKTGAA